MPDPVTGAVVGGSSVLGGYFQNKAAGKAADAQAGAAQNATAEQQRQYDIMRELLQPYVDAGKTSLGQQQALLGLSGTDAQQNAINAISSSPQLQAMMQQGENAMLQNASATGGLRGGNLQGGLAQYRPAMLNQAISQQYQNLAGLTSLGQASAAGVGNAGMQTAAQIGQQYNQIGAAQAGQALAQGKVLGNLFNTPMTILGMQYGSGSQVGFGGLF